MTNKTLNKIILSATTAMFLTACGSSGSSTPSAADTASAKIQAYADDNSNPAPTVADYTAAGVTSITDANLAAMNQLVDSKTGEEVDELSELTSLAGEVDVTAPVITLLGSPTVSIVAGTTYTDAGATAEDTKDGSLTVTVGGDTVDTATPGTYTITYNVSDAAGNAATEVTRVVTVTTAPVLDITAPVISLDGDDTVTILINTPYTDAGATASDDTDGNITTSIISTTSVVDVNTSATYTITYNVSDAAGNPALEETRTVIVSDTQFVVDTANNEVKDIVRDLTWKNTITDAATCPTGFTVPTVQQFQTIIDYSKDYTTTAVLLVDGFDTNLTTVAVDTRPVKTLNGDVDIRRGSVNKTRTATDTICVKGTWAPAAGDFTRDDANNTVTDNKTGLVWSDHTIDWTVDLQTFAEATTTCDNLEMRLPTLVELDSIYNREDNNISSGFVNNYRAVSWSTTEIVGESNTTQWTVNFNDTDDSIEGQIYGKAISETTDTAYVRCVK